MSIVRMRKVVHDRGYAKWIMGFLAVIFIIGFCVMGYSGRNAGPGDRSARNRGGVVAKVNGEAITQDTFESQYEDVLKQMAGQQMGPDAKDTTRLEETVGPLRAEMLRGQTFEQVIDQAVLLQAANKQGIRVSGGEVSKAIDQQVESEINQIRDQIFANSKGPKTDAALDKEIQKMAPDKNLGKLRTEARDAINQNRAKFENQLVLKKLVESWNKSIDTSDKAIQESFDEVHLRQITVNTGKRSDADASKMAKDVVGKLRGGADFAATAKQVSDDAYKSRGGDWGFPIPKMYLPKDIADAAFKLKVGEVSDPVKTAQGYVILKVEARKSSLPKDFNDAKKHEEYKKRYIASMQQQVQRSFYQSIRQSAKVDIIDPEMKAFSMLKTADVRNPKSALDAVKVYESAVGGDDQRDTLSQARIYSQIAAVYEALRRSKTSAKADTLKYRDQEEQALQNALQYTEQNDLRLMLADIMIEKKSFDKAMENLSFVGDNAATDPAAHQEVLRRYQSLKKAGYPKVSAKIAEEQKWLADNAKAEKAAQTQMKQQAPAKP